MGTYDGFIYHRNGAPLMIRKRLFAARRKWRIHWTHRKLVYGWKSKCNVCSAIKCSIREFLRPEHYPYWKESA